MFRYYSKPDEASVRITVVGEHSDGVLRLAVARCSKKDRYVKCIGRGKAEKRLLKDKLYTQYNMAECDAKTFVKLAQQAVADVDKNPTPVRIEPAVMLHLLD